MKVRVRQGTAPGRRADAGRGCLRAVAPGAARQPHEDFMGSLERIGLGSWGIQVEDGSGVRRNLTFPFFEEVFPGNPGSSGSAEDIVTVEVSKFVLERLKRCPSVFSSPAIRSSPTRTSWNWCSPTRPRVATASAAISAPVPLTSTLPCGWRPGTSPPRSTSTVRSGTSSAASAS